MAKKKRKKKPIALHSCERDIKILHPMHRIRVCMNENEYCHHIWPGVLLQRSGVYSLSAAAAFECVWSGAAGERHRLS